MITPGFPPKRDTLLSISPNVRDTFNRPGRILIFFKFIRNDNNDKLLEGLEIKPFQCN